MSVPVDIAALKRRYKPQRLVGRFAQRADSELTSAAKSCSVTAILVDTTVYVHDFSGRLPADASALLDRTLHFNCALCIAEIISGLSQRHPGSPEFEPGWDYYDKFFAKIPQRRLLTPDDDILAQAGLISGVQARTQNYQRHQTKELFNDAAIYLTAAKVGIPVLTANRGDFDLIQQVAGHGEFIHYTAT